MGKIILFLLLTFEISAEINSLQSDCLSCHKIQQIPNSLIYRRYLMKYSTQSQIEYAIFTYLKNPQKEISIMPPQFFLKFPMKQFHDTKDRVLHQNIKAYIKKFDIKKKLILKK